MAYNVIALTMILRLRLLSVISNIPVPKVSFHCYNDSIADRFITPHNNSWVFCVTVSQMSDHCRPRAFWRCHHQYPAIGEESVIFG